MTWTAARLLAAALPVLLAASALAGEVPAPDWAAKLEANKWVKLEREKGRACGVRNGAAVVWLAAERKFLVVGGMQFNCNEDRVGKIVYPYEIQTFDPATMDVSEEAK